MPYTLSSDKEQRCESLASSALHMGRLRRESDGVNKIDKLSYSRDGFLNEPYKLFIVTGRKKVQRQSTVNHISQHSQPF
jgi:hypothetical protein